VCFESGLDDKEGVGLTGPEDLMTSTKIIIAIVVGLLELLEVVVLVICDTLSDLVLSIGQTILNGNSQHSPRRTMDSWRWIGIENSERLDLL
jgi:hypothetical protein